MKKILILGLILFAGFQAEKAIAQNRENQVRDQSVKYQRLMALIDAFYVDTVNLHRLTEDAIVKVLADLDPHSVYISKEEVDEMNEPLEGGFFGIGIQFTILRDTLVVVDVVAGGPSEKVGLQAGDRIVVVEGEDIAGKKLSNTEVRKRLKGEKGTPVNIKVLRGKELMDFRIIRDKIPIYSIDVSYMLDKTTGYIKISRFAATTVEEFEKALKELQAQGMKDLVLDLQGNGGGYMGAAIGISDHLLEGNKMIVYTDGLSSGRREEYSTPAGMLKDGRVVVLIDYNSASASEIVSGALQDWDRGVLVGQRSFGKGLVQRQYPLTDGSMIRLTTAHYYTPSGRCIQKPYSKG
ncbi:MAG: S41 family peptidase, partial [Odoribacter sp.]|nr:S41 family peptidase [Odoribacter sp.]